MKRFLIHLKGQRCTLKKVNAMTIVELIKEIKKICLTKLFFVIIILCIELFDPLHQYVTAYILPVICGLIIGFVIRELWILRKLFHKCNNCN